VPASTAPRCAACWNDWFQAARPDDDDDEINALLTTNRVPPKVPVARHPWPGAAVGEQWAGYCVEAYTVAADDLRTWHAPSWQWAPEGEEPRPIIRARTWKTGGRIALVWTWSLRDGPRVDWRPIVEGAFPRPGELAALDTLLGLLKRSGPGTQPGEGIHWSSNAAALRDIDAEIRRGKRSVTAVALALGTDRATIYRRVKKATGMRWGAYLEARHFAQH
jgi:hypothetical protein